jgi:hypothetical protein
MRTKLFFLALLLVTSVINAYGQHFEFMITGDGRSAGTPGRMGFDENGINKTILRELVEEALAKRPRFILYTGDLVAGYSTEAAFRSQLRDWIKIMRPVYDAGIHVYPVRGNHDASSKNSEAVWNDIFQGRYALPHNGPEGEKNMTFWAQEGNSLIVGLDQWGWHTHAINQGWLDQVLRDHPQTHVFVMGHEMAFKAGHHDDCLDNNEYARDAFITSLSRAGARVYLAGHDHFYDHMEITDPANHPGLNIHQFVLGTAGAPFYHGDEYNGHNGSWQLGHVKHIEDTYGYIWGEVDGPHVWLTFMGRTATSLYQAMDTFEYTAGLGR